MTDSTTDPTKSLLRLLTPCKLPPEHQLVFRLTIAHLAALCFLVYVLVKKL